MREFLEELSAEQQRDPVSLARAKMKPELPKRFYQSVEVAEGEGGFMLNLDGRPVRTPARNLLAVPALSQAERLKVEWEAQKSRIDPATMPVTRLANSVIDGVAREVEAVKDEIVKYAASDLVLYRADTPDSLVLRQARTWDPVVAHAERRLGVRFRLVAGVMPEPQDERAGPALRALLPDDPFTVGALHVMTTVYGSALLTLSVLERQLSAEEAFAAASLDEDWNIEKWGADEEASARRAWRLGEVAVAALFLER